MLTEQGLLHRAQIRNDFVVTPVVTLASAYASGNVLGGMITIDQGAGVDGPMDEAQLSAILQSLVVLDLDNQKQPITFYFFNAAPTAVVDKTAFAPTAADLKKLIATVVVGSADYVTINAKAVANSANQRNLGQVIKPGVAKATAIYCVSVVLGAPTWTAGLQYRFQFSQGL